VPARVGLLGLGTNLSDRRSHLQDAVWALPRAGIEVTASSSVYDTDPVGEVLDQPTFLNACVRVRTPLEPLELLAEVKAIEHRLGRRQSAVPRHGPRVVDVDVLLLGDVALDHPRLHLPHKQLLARRFVLVPALELDVAMALADGHRLAEALLALPASEGVRWAGPPLQIEAPATVASTRGERRRADVRRGPG